MAGGRGYAHLNTRIPESVSIKLFRGVLTKESFADVTLILSQVLVKFPSELVPYKVNDFVRSGIPGHSAATLRWAEIVGQLMADNLCV